MRATPGDVVADRYRLDRLLEVEDGRRTYHATDLALSRAVEVRMPDGDPPDESTVATLREEGEVLARCEAPGVAPVLDLVEWRGGPVLVTEGVAGTSLGAIVRTAAPEPAGRAVPIAVALIDVLSAAACATASGGRMVHRSAVVTEPGRRVVVTGLRPADPAPPGVDPAVPAVCETLFALLTARAPGDPPTFSDAAAREVPPAVRTAVEDGLAGRIPRLPELRAALTAGGPPAAAAGRRPWSTVDIGLVAAVSLLALVLVVGALARLGGGGGGGAGGGGGGGGAPAAETVREVAGGLTIARVPRLRGLRRGEAEARVRAAGFEPATTAVRTAAVTPGMVARQRPRAGAEAPAGSRVSLWVSAGPPGVRVPDVRGLPLSGARRVLNGEGLRIGRLRERAAGGPGGQVVGQVPRPGAGIRAGGEVVLVLSSG